MTRLFNGIFGKVFTINIITIVIGLFVSIMLQYAFVMQYINIEKEAAIRKSVSMLHSRAFMAAATHPNGDAFAREYAEAYTYSTGNYVMFVRNDGVIFLSTYVDKDGMRPSSLSSDFFNEIKNSDKQTFYGKMGMFSERMITVRMNLTINNVTGYILVSTSAANLTQLRHMSPYLFIMPMSFVLLMCVVLSYYLSRRLVRPIKEISKTAAAFSKGELSRRVTSIDSGEIGELADTFNKMAESLEKTEAQRQRFIANVSHELRTPMTTISGFVDGILDGTIPPQNQNTYLCIVQTESKRLSRLVHDLLDITRMNDEHFKLNYSNFDINEMLRICLLSFEKAIENKKLQVNVKLCADICMVCADMDAMQRVLTNLIDNAVKYSNEGGELSISINSVNEETAVSIKNTGAGIGAEDINQIFDRFYKTDKSRGLNQSTGLGLYIVKSLINLHGKEIYVNSTEGQYTEFTFTI